MKKTLIVIMAVLFLVFTVVSCDSSTKLPGEGQNSGSINTPVDQSAAAFTITQTQFKAEKALLAGYSELLKSENYSNGNLTAVNNIITFTKDVTSGDLTIKAGSSYSGPTGFISQQMLSRSLDENISINLNISEADTTPAVSVKFTGSADANMSNIKAESFLVTDEQNNTTKFESTPAVFLATSYDETLKSIILNFTTGTTGTYEVKSEESYFDSTTGKGWIVFLNAEIDNSWHKLNFMVSGSNVISYTLDGWCETTETGPKVAETPAIKGDNGPVTDADAIEISNMLFGYQQYLMATLKFITSEETNTLPDGIEYPHPGTLKFNNYTERNFFDKPVVIKGKMYPKAESQEIYCFDFSTFNGIKDIYLEIGSDGSKTTTGGNCYAFTIGGSSYMHLKDESFLAMIRMFTLSSYMPAVFEYINNGTITSQFSNVSDDGAGKYTFTNAKPKESIDYDGNPEEVSRFTFNGEIMISDNSFEIKDFSIEEDGTDAIGFTASGNLNTDGSPIYIKAEFTSHGGVCQKDELNLVNRLVPYFESTPF